MFNEVTEAYYRGLEVGHKQGVNAGKHELAKELVLKHAEKITKNFYDICTTEKEKDQVLLELIDLVHLMWLHEPEPY